MQKYKVYSYRWVVLATYAFLVIPGGMLWLTYSPLEQTVKTIYNPDPVALLLLTAINPILFIVFTFPAGLLTDKKGFKFVVGLGAILQASFGVLRIFPQDVYLIIMCVGGYSIGGCFITAGIEKLSVRWFPLEGRAVATGVSSMAMLVGWILGLFLTPVLYLAGGSGLNGFLMTNIIYGAVAVIVALAFLLIAKENPPTPPSPSAEKIEVKGVGRMMKTGDLWILALGFFAGFWMITGLLTAYPLFSGYLIPPGSVAWLPAEAIPGVVLGVMVTGGAIGSIVLPIISDKVYRRKPFLVIASLFGGVFSYLLGVSTSFTLSLGSAFFLGFFMVSVLPIALEVCAEIKTIGPTLVGIATGVLFLMGNIGSAIGPFALYALGVDTPNFQPAVLSLLVVGLVIAFASLFIHETYKKK